MSVKAALEALKNQDFAQARGLIALEKPDSYQIQHFLIKGLAELALKDWDGALPTFTEATKRFPSDALLWLNRGIAEENLLLIDAAIFSQEKCLALNPSQAESCGNLSNLYRHKQRFTEAEIMARRALVLGAAKGDALNCLGLALGKQGKFAEAREAFIEAHQAAPDNPDILANRANLETEIFDFDAAWKFFFQARAIEDKPVFRHDEALARLLAGESERGFDLFESRLEMPRALRLHPACPRWQGENLSGKKLLIIAEQGFGDVIQFCRYQKFLGEGDLIWAVPKNLLRLLTSVLRGAVIDETAPLPDGDYFVPIVSLPFMTQKSPSALERNFSAPTAPLLPPGKHQKKIGLVWAGSRTHLRDHERSIGLHLLMPLLDEIKADFYAPLIGDAVREISDLPITRLDHLITDFADTAGLLKQVDYVVSVDTALAHLAGSLGVKTFLLLPHCPDWRWGVAGDKTIWYPSLTLIRQPTYGDWPSVIAKLIGLLKSSF